MPSTPKPWLILQALMGALQNIRIANGYRTDIGAAVSLENTQDPAQITEAITLGSMGINRPEEAGNQNTAVRTRDYEIVIEAVTPITTSANGVVEAHQRMHDIMEDIEQALDAGIPSTPGSIPPRFTDAVFVQRPQGFPAVVMQYQMIARYRR